MSYQLAEFYIIWYTLILFFRVLTLAIVYTNMITDFFKNNKAAIEPAVASTSTSSLQNVNVEDAIEVSTDSDDNISYGDWLI